jgi:hypothetical protein
VPLRRKPDLAQVQLGNARVDVVEELVGRTQSMDYANTRVSVRILH